MSKKTECKQLLKNRAYSLTIGDIELTALKLEGIKATQLGGTINPMGVSLGGQQVEGDDWIIIVKKEGISVPYSVWSQQVASQLLNATGSNVGTFSVVSGDVKLNITDAIKMTETVKIQKFDKNGKIIEER